MADRLKVSWDRKAGVFSFSRLRADGFLVARVLETKLDIDRHFEKTAKALKVEVAAVHRIHSAMLAGGCEEYECDPTAAPPPIAPKVEYMLRGSSQPAADGRKFDSLDAALLAVCPPPDPVVEWGDRDATCALDLDFHRGGAPLGHDLLMAAATLAPRPALHWLTRSGGLRCVYHRAAPYAALDLASVAALSLTAQFPSAEVELLSRTRLPPGEVFRGTQTTDPRAVRALFSYAECSPEAVAAWLEERGMVVGGRYQHTQCPVTPSPGAEANSPPVVVHEDHVFCFLCSAHGRTRGSRVPGHFPFAALCGARVSTMFRACVENLAHWGHARYVAEQVVPRPALARSAYRAALVARHGDDPRIPSVFTAGEPLGLLRFDGHWGTYEGEPVALERKSNIVQTLPAAQVVRDGEVAVAGDRVEWLSQGVDLSKMGYPALVVVWGVQVTQQQDPPEHRVFTVLNTRDLRPEPLRERRPTYLQPADRHPDPWAVVERAYPGVNRAAVELLIAAKGCSEHRAGLPPMVFLTGPTGSGKTSTVLLAAAICGDRVGTVQYTKDVERLRAGLLQAKKQGSFAAFDEYLKHAAAHKATAAEAMEVALGFTEGSMSHMLYVGPVALGELPVLVWSDTAVPPDLAAHAQLGRRIHHVSFTDEMAWEDSLRAAGIPRPEGLRTHGTPEYVHAADSILSGVIDRFFPPGPPTDFADVAAALGFAKLRDSDLAREREGIIRQFFDLVCAAPALSGPEAVRWPDRGWKLVEVGRDTPLSELWRMLADAGDQVKSRALEETDLRKVLCLKHRTRFERRSHGVKMVVRFAAAGPLYNEELRDAAVELGPESAGVHGPGDAEHGQPEPGWFARIPASLLNPPDLGGVQGGGGGAGVGPDGTGPEGD